MHPAVEDIKAPSLDNSLVSLFNLLVSFEVDASKADRTLHRSGKAYCARIDALIAFAWIDCIWICAIFVGSIVFGVVQTRKGNKAVRSIFPPPFAVSPLDKPELIRAFLYAFRSGQNQLSRLLLPRTRQVDRL